MQSVWKNEEIKRKFFSLISWDWFASNLVYNISLLWGKGEGIFAENLVQFRSEISKSHRCGNHFLYLPVNILMVWRATSWAARYTTMCFDVTVISRYHVIKLISSQYFGPLLYSLLQTIICDISRFKTGS